MKPEEMNISHGILSELDEAITILSGASEDGALNLKIAIPLDWFDCDLQKVAKDIKEATDLLSSDHAVASEAANKALDVVRDTVIALLTAMTSSERAERYDSLCDLCNKPRAKASNPWRIAS